MKASNTILISAIFATILIFIGTITTTAYASTFVIPKNSVANQVPTDSEDPGDSDDPTDSSPTVTGTHDFTGLPLTEDGWTDFRYMIKEQGLYQNARVVFVSSSQGDDNIGDDGHYSINDLTFDQHGIFQADGPANAYATLSAGYDQLREGYPDILLLKRGDEWQERFPEWRLSGYSRQAPIIVGSYGDSLLPRPIVERFTTGFGPNHPHRVFNYLAITSLEFTEGLTRLIGGDWWLVEDCLFRTDGSMNIDGRGETALTDVALRRCVIHDQTAVEGGGHVQGMYVTLVNDLLIEEMVLDKNGWVEGTDGGTIYNHNAYIQYGNSGVIFKRNISARASSHGIHQRPGGVMENNLFLQNPLVQFGYGQGSADDHPIASGSILHNVILDSRNIVEGSRRDGRGLGLLVTAAKGVDIFNNIVAHQRSGEWNINGITLGASWDNVESRKLVEDVVLQDNIVYKWQHPTLNGDGTAFRINKAEDYSIANITVENNDFQQTTDKLMNLNGDSITAATTFSGSTYYSDLASPFNPGDDYAGWLNATGETGSDFASVAYPDPDRDIRTYINSLGNNYTDYQAALEAFLGEAVQQMRGYWREDYTACAVNNYIRAGFNKDEIVCSYQ